MKTIATFFLSVLSIGLMAQTMKSDRAHIETSCGELPLINESKANAIDTLHCERLSYDQTHFEPYTTTIFIYDDLGRIISVEQGYNAYDGYQNSYKELYTYTDFDSVETYLSYFWNDTLNADGGWDDTNFRSYDYNNDHNLVRESWMYNPIGEDEWNNRRLFTYEYDDGKLMKINHQYYNIETEDWSHYNYTDLNYENQKLKSRTTYYSSDNGHSWNRNYNFLYNYNSGEMERIEQHFNDNQWKNIRKHTFNLDEEGNILVDLEETWNSFDSAWDTLILNKKEYTFNDDGNMTNYLFRSAYIEWFNVEKEEYVYVDGLLKSSVHYNWDWNEELWYERIRCNMKTAPGVLSTNQPDLQELVSIYPNPAIEQIKVNIPMGVNVSSIALYDVSGKVIDQFDYFPQSINISGLEKGLYFVTINLEDEMITRKLIKQ